MAAPLPEGTLVDRLEGGIRLDLPPRPLGKARLIGCFPLGFGLVFGGLPLLSMLNDIRSEGCMAFVFMLFALPFVAAGVGIAAVGIGLLFPRRMRILLDGRRLSQRERFGPFWWTWHVPRERVRGMQVQTFAQRTGGELSGVLAVDVEGRSSPFMIGRAYPAAWLEGLRDALLEVHGTARAEPTVASPSVPVAPPRNPAEQQPEGSDAGLEYTADSVRISFPAKGVRKANGCLLVLGCLWSAMSLLGLALAIANREGGGAAFVLLFVGVGAAMVLGAVHSGRKRASLEMTGSALIHDSTGLFGRKLRQWPRGSIRGFAVEDSGWKVNEVTQWQLRIDRKDERAVKLLRGRPQNELEWLVSTLRSGPLGRVEAQKGEVKADGAECQVCNSPMTSDIVYCARCRTPHHGQCWQYLGQCSTYGCREIRYTTA